MFGNWLLQKEGTESLEALEVKGVRADSKVASSAKSKNHAHCVQSG